MIALNSSFAYKGKYIDTRTIACEPRVRSVLEGSIHRATDGDQDAVKGGAGSTEQTMAVEAPIGPAPP